MTAKRMLEIIQELYDEGSIIKKLDDKGRPVLRPARTGELQQVYVHRDFATFEELAFWHNEHSAVLQ